MHCPFRGSATNDSLDSVVLIGGGAVGSQALATKRELQRRRTRNRFCLITINHAAMIGPCGPRPRPPVAGCAASGGAGPRSGWKRYTLCVFGSTAIVFAPANVSTVATVVYLSGESWWTTVTLPSPPFGM